MKVRILMWLAFQGWLPTEDVLIHRHLADGFSCPLCEAALKMIHHLFLSCPFSIGVQSFFLPQLGIPNLSSDIRVLWSSWRASCVPSSAAAVWDSGPFGQKGTIAFFSRVCFLTRPSFTVLITFLGFGANPNLNICIYLYLLTTCD